MRFEDIDILLTNKPIKINHELLLRIKARLMSRGYFEAWDIIEDEIKAEDKLR